MTWANSEREQSVFSPGLATPRFLIPSSEAAPSIVTYGTKDEIHRDAEELIRRATEFAERHKA